MRIIVQNHPVPGYNMPDFVEELRKELRKMSQSELWRDDVRAELADMGIEYGEVSSALASWAYDDADKDMSNATTHGTSHAITHAIFNAAGCTFLQGDWNREDVLLVSEARAKSLCAEINTEWRAVAEERWLIPEQKYVIALRNNEHYPAVALTTRTLSNRRYKVKMERSVYA